MRRHDGWADEEIYVHGGLRLDDNQKDYVAPFSPFPHTFSTVGDDALEIVLRLWMQTLFEYSLHSLTRFHDASSPLCLDSMSAQGGLD